MSLAEANRQYFDLISSSYDSKPWFAKVNNQVADFLRAELSWIGIPFVNMGSSNEATGEVRLLDYACGTGLMTRVFAPYVTSTVAIDISSKMISEYTSRAASSPSPSSITATTGNLFDKTNPSPPELSSPQYFNFDIATVGFGFHHFEDVVYAASQLKQRLRPGDADANVTHDTDDTSAAFHKKMSASIVVPNFTVEGVRKFFTEAGFVDVDVVTNKEKSYMEFGGKKVYRTILFAKGRRPVDEKSEL
ncbi:methyltransferase-like protein [Pyrenophora tritici-repentis]|nr:methyltransferase-like protein [Pyrenophora tritici-repentis]KAF7448874.1 methyltransferase protein [Pyrenophora tritici-repentis]KAI0581617.1 methyltransferase-like protein [Pyrenophora tritici-repentis]KAI0591357.1 methyltransferase-like protein [Pyrenophora tritici-repentis]KAI0614487.1 methyltransferase-like protein [Pyrenophora tritici-repentis]